MIKGNKLTILNKLAFGKKEGQARKASTPQGTILVIVHSETEGVLLRDTLADEAYAVRLADCGRQGLAMAWAETPDLIIMDTILPDMMGFQVCEQLKADERTQDVPVIFIGALDDLADKKRAFAVGGVDYITKPFQTQEVWTRTRTHLGLRNLQKRLEEKSAEQEREARYRELGQKTSKNLTERLRILHEIDQSILAARSPENIAVAVVGRIRHLIPCQRVMIIERPQSGQVRLLAAESDNKVGLEIDLAVRQQAFSVPALRNGHLFGCVDLETIQRRSPLQQALYEEGIRSFVIVPLLVGNELVGTLNLEASSAHLFQVEHMTIASEIAAALRIAIRQVRLYEVAQQEIAEREQAEEALRQYTAELETRNSELDAFMHTVAHDLKTPLTALIGFGKLVEKQFDVLALEQIRNSLHILTQNGIMMNNIIDELMLLASVRKIDDIETIALDMAAILGQVRLRLSAMIEEYNAEISVPKKWPVAVGYAAWVTEVWANYLSNAIKYGGIPPRIELGATVEPLCSEQPGEAGIPRPMVRFWVRDNGMGIPAEDQKKLFTLFTRLDQTPTRGYGLGLSIVKRIVQRLGGQVGIESAEGQGSTFWFSLPAAAPPADVADQP